jgi:Sec-independent protein translocase protein TatA
MRWFGYFFPPRSGAGATAVLAQICSNLKTLNMTVIEGFNKLSADAKQLNKALGEIKDLVGTLKQQGDDLKAQLANQELTAEQQAAVDAISATAQQLDDVTPDPVAVPAPDSGPGTGE